VAVVDDVFLVGFELWEGLVGCQGRWDVEEEEGYGESKR
jgi:hypothetical protein